MPRRGGHQSRGGSASRADPGGVVALMGDLLDDDDDDDDQGQGMVVSPRGPGNMEAKVSGF